LIAFGARLQELPSQRSGNKIRHAGARLSDGAPRRGRATSQSVADPIGSDRILQRRRRRMDGALVRTRRV